MRIRSIKPEFWTSEDIAALDWDARLLFIGLWSYVDDNGVGRDNPRLIVADLFPLDDDSRETLARVSRGLQKLSEGGLVSRYTVERRPYLHITSWSKHQRIDKPNKARYPDLTRADTTPSRDSRESVATVQRPEYGTEEQGNRGTEDSAKAGNLVEVATPADETEAANTQALVAEWIDHCQRRPPGNVIGQISKLTKQLLDDDHIPYNDVRRGLATWQQKGLHPSTLPSVVNEVINAKPGGGKQHTTDDLFQRALARTAQREQEAS